MNLDNIKLDVLSLGFGTQSTCIAFMIADGLFPKPDKIIFADLGTESDETYRYIDYALPLLESKGLKIDILKVKDVFENLLIAEELRSFGERVPMIPLWYHNKTYNRPAPLRRQCTADYKINTISTEIRKHLGRERLGRHSVRIWQGITLEEKRRIKSIYTDTFRVNHYPLVEQSGELSYPGVNWASWTKQDCIDYMVKCGYKVPPKSSCYFCPFHSAFYFLQLKANYPHLFARAVQLDNSLRKFNHTQGYDTFGDFYIYKGLVPLEDLNESHLNQDEIFALDSKTCEEGFCFV
jgi:hypothetical protein